MKKTSGDIEGLMRSFGGKAEDFKEIARDEEATQALQRWPLLSSMGAPAEPPPVLTGEQKQSWLNAPGSEKGVVPQLAGRSESDRLASGLDRLVNRGVAPTLSDAAVTHATAEHSLSAQRDEKPAALRRPAASALRAGASEAAPARPLAKRLLGLGEKRKEASSRDLSSKRHVADDSLASIFSRVDQAKKPKSAFGRLFGKDKHKR